MNAETRSADGIFHLKRSILGSLKLSVPMHLDRREVTSPGERLLPLTDSLLLSWSVGLPAIWRNCLSSKFRTVAHVPTCIPRLCGCQETPHTVFRPYFRGTFTGGSSFRINGRKMYWGSWIEWYGFCVTLGLSLQLPRSASIL